MRKKKVVFLLIKNTSKALSKFHLDDSKTEKNLQRKRYLFRDLNYKHHSSMKCITLKIMWMSGS